MYSVQCTVSMYCKRQVKHFFLDESVVRIPSRDIFLWKREGLSDSETTRNVP